MVYKIVETEAALKDLDSILEYITFSLANPDATSAFANQIEECYSHLEQMPAMYELCHDPRLRTLGYHKAVIRNYIMVYKIDEKNKIVIILRFFYERQNYEKLI